MNEHPKLGVHLSHCNFGENAGHCKYGDDIYGDGCPALDPSWSWFGANMQRAEIKQLYKQEAVTEQHQRVFCPTCGSKIELMVKAGW